MMHKASGLELAVYGTVVAALLVRGLWECFQLSFKTVPVIIANAGSPLLPVKLSSILAVDRQYVATHYPPLLQRAAAQLYSNNNAKLLEYPLTDRLLAGLSHSPRDVSDVQWREFRQGLPQLAAGLLAYVAVSQLLRKHSHVSWMLGCLLVAVIFQVVLHGGQAIWPLLLCISNYGTSFLLAGKRFGVAAMWMLQLSTLVYIRYNDGLHLAHLLPSLSWLSNSSGMLRWHIHHNLAMLRMLSFFMELHWTRQTAKRKPDLQNSDQLAKAQQYSWSVPGFCTYCLYCFYPPLYIAGPIMTFDSFASQSTTTTRVSKKQVAWYAARWTAALLMLEIMTRTLYVNAMAKYGMLTSGLLPANGVHVTPLHFALVSFLVLVFMWLKFLVVWRFFRLMALCDGFDPPENMQRCICNNYDVQGFWKGWHSSYNRWLVRYLYIPLGGSSWQLFNVWVCFIFVALWHDLDIRLLAWGLLMPAAFLPELSIKAFGRSRFCRPFQHAWWYRQLAALCATVNIIALMSANLVGFVVGPQGLLPFVRETLGQPVMAVMIVVALFSAVQLMFAIREHEARHKQRKQLHVA